MEILQTLLLLLLIMNGLFCGFILAWQDFTPLFRILLIAAGVLYLSGALLVSRYGAEPLYAG